MQVPAPTWAPVPQGPAWLPAALLDAAIRTAAVIAVAGSLALLAVRMPSRTPLREDLAAIARDRSWERYLPEWDRLRSLLADPDERRVVP